MEHEKRVRVVKRERRQEAAAPAAPRPATAAGAAREVKDVVSGWVRDHQRRSEEFRSNYATLLGQLGLTAPWAGKAAGVAAPAFSAGK